MKQFLCIFALLVVYVAADIGLDLNQGYNYGKPPSQSYLPPNQANPSYHAPNPSYLPPSQPNPTYLPPAEQEHQRGMPFEFAYSVNDQPTMNVHSHKANSDGDVTRGEYRVLLPDGRMQIVKYTADWKNGYNAEVTYEGEARYDPPKPQGLYGAPSHNQAQNQGYYY